MLNIKTKYMKIRVFHMLYKMYAQMYKMYAQMNKMYAQMNKMYARCVSRFIKLKRHLIKHKSFCKGIDELTCSKCMISFTTRSAKHKHIKRNNCSARKYWKIIVGKKKI